MSAQQEEKLALGVLKTLYPEKQEFLYSIESLSKNERPALIFEKDQDLSDIYLLEENYYILILDGEIEVSNINNSNILNLIVGDILDPASLNENYNILSLQKGIMLQIPKEILFKDSELKIRAEEINKKILLLNINNLNNISNNIEKNTISNAIEKLDFIVEKPEEKQTQKNKNTQENINDLEFLTETPDKIIGSEPYTPSWYLRIFKKNKFLLSQIFLASIFVQLFSIASPLSSLIIFDRVFGRQNISALWVVSAGLLIILLFDIGIKFFRSYVLSFQLNMLDQLSLNNIHQNLFNISFKDLKNEKKIKAFTQGLPELIKTHLALGSTVFIYGTDAFLSVFSFLILLVMNAKFAIICFLTIVPMMILTWTSSGAKKQDMTNFTKEQQTAQSRIMEFLHGIETVKSLNAKSFFTKTIRNDFDNITLKSEAIRFSQINEGVTAGFISNLGSSLTLFVGAYEVLNHGMSFGTYMFINMISRVLLNNFQKLITAQLKLNDSTNSINNLKELIGLPDKLPQEKSQIHLDSIQGNIEIVNLSFKYENANQQTLENINLSIKKGQKVILTGKSGAGKTTLIRLLQGFYTPDTGHITIDNYNIADIDEESLRKNIGVALQKPAIFGASIRDNIALGCPDAPMREIADAASMADLDKFLIRLPEGFDTELNPRGGNLSAGQVCQISLARAFLLNPKILILDEALAFCDRISVATIFNKMLEVFKNNTCIFVSDYIPLHKTADLIVVLHEGKIIEQGSYEELMNQKNYYYYLHG